MELPIVLIAVIALCVVLLIYLYGGHQTTVVREYPTTVYHVNDYPIWRPHWNVHPRHWRPSGGGVSGYIQGKLVLPKK